MKMSAAIATPMKSHTVDTRYAIANSQLGIRWKPGGDSQLLKQPRKSE